MKKIVWSQECLVGICTDMHKQDLMNLESLKTAFIIKNPR